MAKDSTEALTAGPNTKLWIAPVGTAEPANSGAAFTGSWVDMGYLSDPPAMSPNTTNTDMEAWNAEDPLRTFTSTINTVELKLFQSNRATFELYFGPLTYTAEAPGVSIEPNPAAAAAEKIMCLELVDGANVLRIYWRRCTVSDIADLSMDKDAGIIYDVTLKRLTPASGSAFRIQTNVVGLVSA